MDQNNKYTSMQRHQYDSTADIMAIENHRGHDSNPDYYGLLLKEIKQNPDQWTDKTALDFGCGIGRNVDNLLRLAKWKFVDGCDISSENITRAGNFLNSVHTKELFNLYTTTGITLDPIKDNQYDFVMSTIVLQHIAVYDIRTSLLKDIYRVMKTGGLFSFQMAQYNSARINCAKYYDNVWDAPATNGAFDVSIDNPQNLIDDLVSFGFKDVTYTLTPEWDANNKCYLNSPDSKWIFLTARK